MVKNFISHLLFSAILVIITVTGYETISLYYSANPYINGIILLTLIVGFLIYTVKIFSLNLEYRFMNSVAFGKLKLNDSSLNNYPITKSIAKNLGITSSSKTISKSLDEILDELLSTIESGKDLSKYLINLAVFLGLIGTFYGLLLTIGSVSNVIDGLSIDQQDFGIFFNTLRDGLKSPLSGMTIAFSSSLFGLVTSLILGFYEIITRGVKQHYYEFCENQIRLYYRSSSIGKSDSANINQILNSKLDDLIKGINKINDNFQNSNQDLQKELITEIKTVSKNIKNLENK
ncbi:MAG: MotA/TolQ/ExbB proton channel family protein [Flavobacteriales bacterium]|nr:MotA/TolQ/ExbB proton channel family protein [Flavobacteriales bacterium]